MGISKHQKNLNPTKSFQDPLSKLVDGEYKIRLNGTPTFYDSDESSSIDFHFFVYKDDGTTEKMSKKRFLNNQFQVDLAAANFAQAGIDVSQWASSPDLAEDFRRACEKLTDKVLMIRKYSKPKPDNPREKWSDFEILGLSNDVPATSNEEQLPF